MFRMNKKIEAGEVYIIAEMSANHGGDVETALRIVREAAKAGADCVKIQTYTADTITINCDNEYFRIHDGLWDGYNLYDLYSEAYTPWEWQERVKLECEKNNIDFLSTPFDKSAVDFLESIGCEAYKIASFELVDIPLIEYAASKKKPMIISTGMASIDEIEEAVEACKRVGNNNIVLLKCTSEYPALWPDMHLGNISDMRDRFDLPIGISDHSIGSLVPTIAVALGARIIEKHIKLNTVSSVDSDFSMSIDDFESMVKDVKHTQEVLKGPDYSLTEGEKHSLKFRRSIFAVDEIKQGDVFTEKNIKSIRPSDGLHPRYYKSVLGKRAACDIAFGQPLDWDLVSEE